MQVKDRRGRAFVLGGTAEEMFVDLIRGYELSARDLPLYLYQFSTKFRDELRARGGLLRAREFLMKDAYSFHSSEGCMRAFYMQMAEVYQRILTRCGLPTHCVTADNGYMGGSVSHEFIAEHAAGESDYFTAAGQSAAEHIDIAQFLRGDMNPDELLGERTEVAAQRGPTIADGVAWYRAPPWRQIKSVLYKLRGGTFVLVAIRGDLEINEAKHARVLETSGFTLASEEEVVQHGSCVGFLSPLRIRAHNIGDISLTSVRNFTTGADVYQRDTINVNYGRDFTCEILADIATARDGDLTPDGGARLELRRGIEVGNIFQLGTHYSDRMRAHYSANDGSRKPFFMGCYGIGIGRTLQAIAELHHSERGPLWPQSVAPFSCHILPLHEKYLPLGKELGTACQEKELPTLVDDRRVSPGVKFADSDLVGASFAVIVSERSMAAGGAEVVERNHNARKIVPASREGVLSALNALRP